MSVVREGQEHYLQVGVRRRVEKNSEMNQHREMLPPV